MSAASRAFQTFFRPARASICAHCRRALTTSTAHYAGHSKWANIRHTKGATDKATCDLRKRHAASIALYSRLHGADLQFNPQLATAVTAAKKAGVPKLVIDKAIARGQGRSLDGVSLESVTLEVISPPNIAVIIDIETDNRIRTLHELKSAVKKARGTAGSTKFFFTRLGRVVFEQKGGAVAVEDVMDALIEAGAEDMEVEDGNIVVWTKPHLTSAVIETVSDGFELNVLSSEIVWSPNSDTKVGIDDAEAARTFGELLAAIREFPEVQAVYSNAVRGEVSPEEWSGIEESLDL